MFLAFIWHDFCCSLSYLAWCPCRHKKNPLQLTSGLVSRHKKSPLQLTSGVQMQKEFFTAHFWAGVQIRKEFFTSHFWAGVQMQKVTAHFWAGACEWQINRTYTYTFMTNYPLHTETYSTSLTVSWAASWIFSLFCELREWISPGAFISVEADQPVGMHGGCLLAGVFGSGETIGCVMGVNGSLCTNITF